MSGQLAIADVDARGARNQPLFDRRAVKRVQEQLEAALRAPPPSRRAPGRRLA